MSMVPCYINVGQYTYRSESFAFLTLQVLIFHFYFITGDFPLAAGGGGGGVSLSFYEKDEMFPNADMLLLI